MLCYHHGYEGCEICCLFARRLPSTIPSPVYPAKGNGLTIETFLEDGHGHNLWNGVGTKGGTAESREGFGLIAMDVLIDGEENWVLGLHAKSECAHCFKKWFRNAFFYFHVCELTRKSIKVKGLRAGTRFAIDANISCNCTFIWQLCDSWMEAKLIFTFTSQLHLLVFVCFLILCVWVLVP